MTSSVERKEDLIHQCNTQIDALHQMIDQTDKVHTELSLFESILQKGRFKQKTIKCCEIAGLLLLICIFVCIAHGGTQQTVKNSLANVKKFGLESY